jgi:hypothetical protein
VKAMRLLLFKGFPMRLEPSHLDTVSRRLIGPRTLMVDEFEADALSDPKIFAVLNAFRHGHGVATGAMTVLSSDAHARDINAPRLRAHVT